MKFLNTLEYQNLINHNKFISKFLDTIYNIFTGQSQEYLKLKELRIIANIKFQNFQILDKIISKSYSDRQKNNYNLTECFKTLIVPDLEFLKTDPVKNLLILACNIINIEYKDIKSSKLIFEKDQACQDITNLKKIVRQIQKSRTKLGISSDKLIKLQITNTNITSENKKYLEVTTNSEIFLVQDLEKDFLVLILPLIDSKNTVLKYHIINYEKSQENKKL
jgi:hypothetical protein